MTDPFAVTDDVPGGLMPPFFMPEISEVPRDFGQILQRLDGTYVIAGGTYHVIPADPTWQQVVDYAASHPDRVTVEQPPAPPTLEEIKAAKLAEIAAARWQAETGGVEFGGLRMHTDRESQAKYTGAVVTLQATGQHPPSWKGITGWLPIPDGETLLGLAMAVQAHIGECFVREAELEAAVQAAQTAGEVEAITWGI